MKKLYLFLIILILSSKCALDYKMKFPSSIGILNVEYVGGSIKMPFSVGFLIFYENKIIIKIKQDAIGIPYDRITNFSIAENQDFANKNIGKKFPRQYHPRPIIESNFWDALIVAVASAIIAYVGAEILTKITEDYDILSLEFVLEDNIEKALLKAKDKDLKKIIPILYKKIKLQPKYER